MTSEIKCCMSTGKQIDCEQECGVRLSWNLIPSVDMGTLTTTTTNLLLRVHCSPITRVGVPVGCIWTPLKNCNGTLVVQLGPFTCSGCDGIFNRYCCKDQAGWVCCFCQHRNLFLSQESRCSNNSSYRSTYNTCTETVLSAATSTVEYSLSHSQSKLHNVGTSTAEIMGGAEGTPLFVFVLDTCLCEDDAQALLDSIQQVLQLLPYNAAVGFVTFDSDVRVYDLSDVGDIGDGKPGFATFDGALAHSPAAVAESLRTTNLPAGSIHSGKFLFTLAECESKVDSVLQKWLAGVQFMGTTAYRQRHTRCVGAALTVALGLVDTFWHDCRDQKQVEHPRVRVMVFLGGPGTCEPGKIVECDYGMGIRNHSDLAQDNSNTQYYHRSKEFFSHLANLAAGTTTTTTSANLLPNHISQLCTKRSLYS